MLFSLSLFLFHRSFVCACVCMCVWVVSGKCITFLALVSTHSEFHSMFSYIFGKKAISNISTWFRCFFFSFVFAIFFLSSVCSFMIFSLAFALEGAFSVYWWIKKKWFSTFVPFYMRRFHSFSTHFSHPYTKNCSHRGKYVKFRHTLVFGVSSSSSRCYGVNLTKLIENSLKHT